MNFKKRYARQSIYDLSADHLGPGNVPLLVQKIQETLLLFDSEFLDFLRVPPLFSSTGHPGPRDIAAFIDEVEVSILPLHARFRHLLCHNDITPLSTGFALPFLFQTAESAAPLEP